MKNQTVKKIDMQKVIIFGILILLLIFFSFANPTFRRYTTFLSLMGYTYYIAFMAIGVTFPLLTGGVDLSIGTGLICYALTGGYLVVYKGWPVWLGLLVAVLFGVVIGLFNGFAVAVLDLPPFLATLCTCMITRGLGSICSNGTGVPWPNGNANGAWFRSLFRLKINDFTIPIGIIWVVLAVFLMTLLLNHTKVGRYILAIGSNKEAARLCGINVVAYQISAYVISGFFAGLAGIAFAASFATIQPGLGAGFELDAIGAAIIGGVSTAGGYGTVTGTILGVLVISLLKTGLPYVGLQANWQQIIIGIVLISAIMIDIIRNKRARAS
ncbi:MAG: ABC transporter permease [Lachnospiraceae bacterium]|nr:ABC transporter permease [Lachnospiraceae bacterium]